MVNLQEVINYITGRNKIGNLSKGVNMAFQIIEKDGKRILIKQDNANIIQKYGVFAAIQNVTIIVV